MAAAKQYNLEDLPKSKLEAIMLGVKEYYTGEPCQNGHFSHRTTHSGCSQCRKDNYTANADEVNAYNKHWRKTHPGYAVARRAREKRESTTKTWAIDIRRTAKYRCKGKDIPFTITWEEIESLTVEYCPVFGCKFVYCNNGRWCNESASLDRIKPELGYVSGNCAVISWRANCLKRDANSAELQILVDWMRSMGV